MQIVIKHKQDIILLGLCIAVAVGFNPAWSALTLLILKSHEIADKYFNVTVFDQNKKQLDQFNIELQKVISKQSKFDLTGAFGAK